MATLAELEARVALLEARLDEAESLHELLRLKARYGELVDARTAPGVDDARRRELAREISELFTADGVWDGGPGIGRAQGRAEIEERLARRTLAFSWHFFVKPRLNVAGERAFGTWDLLAPFTTADGRALWMTGVESDEYRREDGVWLHSRMQLRVVFSCPYETGWAARSESSAALASDGQGPIARSAPQASGVRGRGR
jgi:hypothetical protein